jgi:PiT family inorganic phosphate transporter
VTSTLLLLIITVLVALAFDFLNGFHDAANSIATVVSTRVLSPKLAVVWAAFFNVVAAFFLGTAVAKTIGQRDDSHRVGHAIRGHRRTTGRDCLGPADLVVGLAHIIIPRPDRRIRAAMMRSGYHVIIVEGWYKTLIFIVVAPIMGLILGFTFMVAIFWLLREKPPQRIDKWFRKLQLLSAAAYSLGHGGNDAQKTMGIVASAFYGAHYMTPAQLAGDWGPFHWPIILAAHTAIALGTYFGGWRIVHTMGSRITKLRPVGGFCAETTGAITLFATALAGIPVSTTHTITGAIVGVGATTRLSAVRWGVARRIVWAWILTIPASALVAAVVFAAIRFVHPRA